VVQAAAATFFNNFVVQTALLSMLPSLAVPFWALPKTILNLGFAGFALAPIWTGYVGHLSYHSITMTLEIEAYVVAAFAACVYPRIVWRGLREGDFKKGLAQGLVLMLRTTVLAGIMLLIAATYEATTLILLG
jgi:hypothetical protein